MAKDKVKIGIIGIGDRGVSFVYNFRLFPELAEITGIYDVNRPRLEAMAKWHQFTEIPRHDTWKAFVKGSRYDLVLVTTPDWTHPEMILKSLGAGYNIFADKPLANTPDGLVKVMQASEKAKGLFLMGFNVRYSNLSRKMKLIAQRGELGSIKVGICNHPEHGIRYFRRWHKFRNKTQGLVIHKGCHQLDILNWIIGSYPVEVYAQGDLAVFKGDKQVAGCHVCGELRTCPHARRLEYKAAQEMYDTYVLPSKVDGYHRNYCPMDSQATVPDYYLVTIRYANGARATYSEIHFAARSRADFMFFGDKGEMCSPPVGGGEGVSRMDRLSGEKAVYEVVKGQGGHGGADPMMTLAMIKSVLTGKSQLPPPESGVRSSIIGIAAMRSIDENRPVAVEELIPLEYLRRNPDPDIEEDAVMEAMVYEQAAGAGERLREPERQPPKLRRKKKGK